MGQRYVWEALDTREPRGSTGSDLAGAWAKARLQCLVASLCTRLSAACSVGPCDRVPAPSVPMGPMQVREGRSASLSAFVIPAIVPKACVVVRHTIRPLCLHQRITQFDTTRPTNELLITGAGSGCVCSGWGAGMRWMKSLPIRQVGNCRHRHIREEVDFLRRWG